MVVDACADGLKLKMKSRRPLSSEEHPGNEESFSFGPSDNRVGEQIESPIVQWAGQRRARALTLWLRSRVGISA